jgi:hypothetical protein
MAARILLLLILFSNPGSLIASATVEVNVTPEELVRLKKGGATGTDIQSIVERLQSVLFEKRTQAELFQFVPEVIPSPDTGRSCWSIRSRSEVLLTLCDNGGYLSTKTKAEVISRQLNRALQIGDGEFTSTQRNGQSTVVFQNSRGRLMIASASEGDAAFFGENKTTSLVTKRWADVLNRFWRSLPPVLLHPLPDPLTLQDLILLAKSGIADSTLISFLNFRDIDSALRAERIKQLQFSKAVAQYLTKRLSTEPQDGMRRGGYFGSYNHCSRTNISIVGSVSFGASVGFHFNSQRGGSAGSQTRGSVTKGSHSGVRGRTRSTSSSNRNN